MTRRRRRRGPPTCNKCGRTVLWLRMISLGGAWRTFDPRPIDTSKADGRVAYPVEGALAWHTRELVEDLMVRRQCSQTEAEEEAHAMPWHARHVCPTDAERKNTE